jgi:hypothetical protein
VSDANTDYASSPALSKEQWYSTEQHPLFELEVSGDESHVARIEKKGSILSLRNQRGESTRISDRSAIKALAAIALRAFTLPDGTPLITNAVLQRIEQGQVTHQDMAALRCLLPPPE